MKKIVGHLAIVLEGKNVDMSVYVHRDYQNKGIGQRMVSLIIDYCKMKGYKGIMIVTERCNRRAIHIYKKLGFQVVFARFEYEMHLPLQV